MTVTIIGPGPAGVCPKRRLPPPGVGEIRCVDELIGTCMADQRRPHSTAANAPQRGFIVFDGGFSTIDCVIRYTAASGANLEFENVADVPRHFFLHIDDWTPSRQCVVIWRMGSVLGVEFEEDDSRRP